MMPKFKIGEVVKTNAYYVTCFKIVSMIKTGGGWVYKWSMGIVFNENCLNHLTKKEEKIFVKQYK